MKLNLSEVDPQTGFQEIVWAPTETAPSSEETVGHSAEAKAASEVDSSAFEISDGFWAALGSDPWFRRDLERMIQLRVEKKSREAHEELKQQILEEARDQGFREGMIRAQEKWTEIENRWNKIAGELLQEKEAILHQHEAEWCRAMRHLIKRFMVPRGERLMEGIEKWLSESLAGFSSNQKIVVSLPGDEYDRMTAVMEKKGQSVDSTRWRIERDTGLAPGEVRCECAGGGMFFSPSKELERLDSWISEEWETAA